MTDGTQTGERVGGEWRGRRWAIAGVTGAQGLTGLSIRVTEVADGEARVVLTRNEVSDAGMWRGTFTNRTDSPCRDVAVEVRFHDGFGAPVGETNGRAGRLDPGDSLDLRVRAPDGAVGLQVRAVRWRTGEASVELGPCERLRFGRSRH